MSSSRSLGQKERALRELSPDNIRQELAGRYPARKDIIIDVARALVHGATAEEVHLNLFQDRLPAVARSILRSSQGSMEGALRIVLAAGLDPNAELPDEPEPMDQDYPRTLLEHADDMSNPSLVELLLRAGAWPDGNGAALFRSYILERMYESALLLTRYGASPHLWGYQDVRAIMEIPHLGWNLAGLPSSVRNRLPGYTNPRLEADIRKAQAALQEGVGSNLARYLWVVV